MTVADVAFVTDRELVAAPGPAAREYGPAVLGLHTLAESVNLCTLAIVRLKCTFRHVSSSFKTIGSALEPLSRGRT